MEATDNTTWLNLPEEELYTVNSLSARNMESALHVLSLGLEERDGA